MRQRTVLVPSSVRAAARHSMMVVFPEPDGPTSMMPWRTRYVSYSWMHLFIQEGCACKPRSATTCTEEGPE